MKHFYIDKRYSEMNRREKREYKRWLVKVQQWDGEVVCENIDKNHSIKNINQVIEELSTTDEF